jgi:hypothetical protein
VDRNGGPEKDAVSLAFRSLFRLRIQSGTHRKEIQRPRNLLREGLRGV